MQKKKQSVSKLKKKLDSVFSKYIRLRDSFDVNGELSCTCVTCGATKPVKNMQAGHFMSRRYNATRFHEKNVNPQCMGCNMYDQGRQYDHAIYIDKIYGDGTAADLRKLSTGLKQWKAFELEELIEEYKNKAKEITQKATHARFVKVGE